MSVSGHRREVAGPRTLVSRVGGVTLSMDPYRAGVDLPRTESKVVHPIKSITYFSNALSEFVGERSVMKQKQ